MERKSNFNSGAVVLLKMFIVSLFSCFLFINCADNLINNVISTVNKEKENEKNKDKDGNTEIFKAGSVDFKMIKIPEVNEILLGDKGQDDNLPHKVSLKDFWIAEFETTQELYDTVMGGNYSWAFSDNPHKGEVQQKRPCDILSWYECAAFCNELTKKVLSEKSCVYYSDEAKTKIFTKEDAETCKQNYLSQRPNVFADWSKDGFRLPTEAEWIYAAHGGKIEKYAGANDDAGLEDIAWFRGNSEGKTHQVGLKKANAYGLYDISGNVCEWVWDWYADIAESSEIIASPKGPAEDSSWGKVLRGGSWAYDKEDMIIVRRDCCGADGKIPFTPNLSRYLGMRIARNGQ